MLIIEIRVWMHVSAEHMAALLTFCTSFIFF